MIIKMSLQHFGGRGGTSGVGGGGEAKRWISQLPKDEEYKAISKKSELPELEGTEKQVKWAQDIRIETLRELHYYTMNYASDGRPKSGFQNLTKDGNEYAVQRIKNVLEVHGNVSDDIRSQVINHEIETINDHAKRVRVYNEIASHTSAKWWIDHRDYSDKAALKKKIDS